MELSLNFEKSKNSIGMKLSIGPSFLKLFGERIPNPGSKLEGDNYGGGKMEKKFGEDDE